MIFPLCCLRKSGQTALVQAYALLTCTSWTMSHSWSVMLLKDLMKRKEEEEEGRGDLTTGKESQYTSIRQRAVGVLVTKDASIVDQDLQENQLFRLRKRKRQNVRRTSTLPYSLTACATTLSPAVDES
jgi:hypothetical protein